MDTMSAVISALHAEGFPEDFSFSAGQAVQADNPLRTFPEQFIIIEKAYRFEEDTNPENEAVIYAVTSAKLGIKGFIVTAMAYTVTRRLTNWSAN